MGAECTYKSVSPKDKARVHKFGEKVLRGIITGYEQRAGGGWTGNMRFVDWEELEEAENATDVLVKTMNMKQITMIKNSKDAFVFPLVEKALTQPGIPPKERAKRERDQKIRSKKSEPPAQFSDD
jgi:hypothetical protein